MSRVKADAGTEGGENQSGPFRYGVYGLTLHSEIPLSLPESGGAGLATIEISLADPDYFVQATRGAEMKTRSEWYRYATLDDGASYVRWTGLGEFLVFADGRRIRCARDPEAPMESFQVYLLGQALSFALVKAGFEPLHATAVAVDGQAIALLGWSGFGKSSLAACFLAAGDSLLTDDLLLLEPCGTGLRAHPGPARIKLFPGLAKRFLGEGAGVPMNTGTEKLVIPLGGHQYCTEALPLRAIYALAPPREKRHSRRIGIEIPPMKEAFLSIVGNTFNYMVVDPSRLQRQVRETNRLLSAVAVKKLTYPRGLGLLPAVREAVLADLDSVVGRDSRQ